MPLASGAAEIRSRTVNRMMLRLPGGTSTPALAGAMRNPPSNAAPAAAVADAPRNRRRLIVCSLLIALLSSCGGDRVLELAHPLAQRPARGRQPLRSEDQQRDHEDDDQLSGSDVRHGAPPVPVMAVAGGATARTLTTLR